MGEGLKYDFFRRFHTTEIIIKLIGCPKKNFVITKRNFYSALTNFRQSKFFKKLQDLTKNEKNLKKTTNGILCKRVFGIKEIFLKKTLT